LRALIENGETSELAIHIESIGRTVSTQGDDIFITPLPMLRRNRISARCERRFVVGVEVRDWVICEGDHLIFPYDDAGNPVEESSDHEGLRLLWQCRTVLANTLMFGGKTKTEVGLKWFEYGQWLPHRFRTPYAIAFAFVSTHNHFVLDRGGKVFNRSAPIIKLPSDATEGDHHAVLGLLNCSSACFWMKQTFQTKGSSGIGRGVYDEKWESFFEFTSAGLQPFPLPTRRPLILTRQLDKLSQDHQSQLPANVMRSRVPTRTMLAEARSRAEQTHGKMIAVQEELDWECYRLYGLIDEDLKRCEPPPLNLGERAFEIVLARKMAKGETQTAWFERHGSTPITQLPTGWPDDYGQLVDLRIALIDRDPNIRLIEQPEYKRRWNTEPWESQLERALREWLLDRLESYFDFDGRMNDAGKPTARLPIALTTVGKLADIARQDPDFLQVGELFRDDPAFDVSRLVAELVEAESVPLLPILRYKPSGLRKREEWEKTWALQRQEDAIDARTKLPRDHADHLSEQATEALKKKQVGTIPVPPKYTSADFLKSDYWRLRGKLDVPKERWVSFPHCEGPDGTLVVAWAGYDHLQLARAISAYYVDVQERLGGRDDPRLIPLLACLFELLPWLKQWHNDIDPEFGVPMGDYFEGFIQEEARQLGKTVPEIKAWKPPQRTTRRPRASGAGTRSTSRRRTKALDSPEE